jgi:hypothetical protein
MAPMQGYAPCTKVIKTTLCKQGWFIFKLWTILNEKHQVSVAVRPTLQSSVHKTPHSSCLNLMLISTPCDTHIIHGHKYIKEYEAVCVPRHISQSTDSWQKIFSRLVGDFRKRRHFSLLKQNKGDKGPSGHQSWRQRSRKHYWIPCPFNRLAGSPAPIPKPCPNTVNARPAPKTLPWESHILSVAPVAMCQQSFSVRVEVLTAVLPENQICWDMILCRWASGSQHFNVT